MEKIDTRELILASHTLSEELSLSWDYSIIYGSNEFNYENLYPNATHREKKR